MTATVDVPMPMSEVVRGVTLVATLTGVRRARLRLWLGVRLMKLAGAVMGCAMDVDITPVTPPTPQG